MLDISVFSEKIDIRSFADWFWFGDFKFFKPFMGWM